MRSLKRGNWSTHELERLRELYPRSPKESVARLLRRSVTSVQRKAQQIFCRGPVAGSAAGSPAGSPAESQAGITQPRSWSEADDQRLREGFGVIDMSDLCLVLQRAEPEVTERIEGLAGRRNETAPKDSGRRGVPPGGKGGRPTAPDQSHTTGSDAGINGSHRRRAADSVTF